MIPDGITGFETFLSERITSDTKDFFSDITSHRNQAFQSHGQESGNCDANSNIISRLLALFSKLSRKIDMQTALKFPLSAVPLSLAHPDGSRRETNKNVFSHILLEECEPEKTKYPRKKDVIAYLIDLIALV